MYAYYEQFLQTIKIINNDMFNFCIREKESLEHALYKSEKMQTLSQKRSILTWLFRK